MSTETKTTHQAVNRQSMTTMCELRMRPGIPIVTLTDTLLMGNMTGITNCTCRGCLIELQQKLLNAALAVAKRLNVLTPRT